MVMIIRMNHVENEYIFAFDGYVQNQHRHIGEHYCFYHICHHIGEPSSADICMSTLIAAYTCQPNSRHMNAYLRMLPTHENITIIKNMDIPNVYNYLINQSYDPHALKSGYFILLPHQVIPKYYLYSSSVNKLILHYSVGSGKSAAAAFALLHNLLLYQMYKFNTQYIPNKAVKSDVITQNVIVVGGWQTQAQIEVELMRPEFGINPIEKFDELSSLLNSTITENVELGEAKRNAMIKTIDKDIKFMGYQSFFNAVFPNLSSE